MTTPEQILKDFSNESFREQPQLILQYAKRIRSWASEVIGEDYKFGAELGNDYRKIRLANAIKSEQRQRAGIGEKG